MGKLFVNRQLSNKAKVFGVKFCLIPCLPDCANVSAELAFAIHALAMHLVYLKNKIQIFCLIGTMKNRLFHVCETQRNSLGTL